MPYELDFVIDQHGQTYRADDIQRTMAAVTAAVSELAQQWAAWSEKVLAAFQVAAEALAESMRPALQAIKDLFNAVDAVDLVPLDDRELGFRDYAAWFNARHPGQRVSWRRLSRPQRQSASWAYLARES